MNKARLLWGTICVVIAGALTVANLRLPPENLMFQVGDVNMPWVPPVALAIAGIILLATACGREKTGEEAEAGKIDPARAALNKRMETIAWGAFLILLGGFMFVPEEIIRGGWWSIGVGAIMLGLNVSRRYYGLRMSGFTTFLGIISVLGGVLDLLGIGEINGAVLIIVLGAYLILKPWFDRRQFFGKAEIS